MPDEERPSVARDAGSVTAELAVALPAVVLVLGACAALLQLAAAQIALQDSVALAARALGRGERPPMPVESWRDGDLVCAAASRELAPQGLLPSIRLSASSCALADGG